MKKLGTLGIVAALAVLPAMVEAQEEASISASASILNTFTIDNDRGVEFGAIDQAEESHEHTQSGRFSIVYNSSGNTVYFVEEQPLTHETDASATIAVSWLCNINDTLGDAEAGSGLGGCADGDEFPLAWNDEGKITRYFHVGGAIDGTALDSHPLGKYNGTLTLTNQNPGT